MAPVGDDVRLRPPLCGKALSFCGTCFLKDLLRAGCKGKPSGLLGGGRCFRRQLENRRIPANRTIGPPIWNARGACWSGGPVIEVIGVAYG